MFILHVKRPLVGKTVYEHLAMYGCPQQRSLSSNNRICMEAPAFIQGDRPGQREQSVCIGRAALWVRAECHHTPQEYEPLRGRCHPAFERGRSSINISANCQANVSFLPNLFLIPPVHRCVQHLPTVFHPFHFCIKKQRRGVHIILVPHNAV